MAGGEVLARNGVLATHQRHERHLSLRIDSSLYSTGATITNARIGGTLVTLP